MQVIGPTTAAFPNCTRHAITSSASNSELVYSSKVYAHVYAKLWICTLSPYSSAGTHFQNDQRLVSVVHFPTKQPTLHILTTLLGPGRALARQSGTLGRRFWDSRTLSRGRVLVIPVHVLVVIEKWAPTNSFTKSNSSSGPLTSYKLPISCNGPQHGASQLNGDSLCSPCEYCGEGGAFEIRRLSSSCWVCV